MSNGESCFLADNIFAVNQIHLISGPAHCGKTTLALQIYSDWLAGRDILGRKSYPMSACYIGCNCNKRALEASMRRLGLEPSSLPHLSLVETLGRDDYNLESVWNLLGRRKMQPQVLFLDGFSALCRGKSSDQKDATDFLLSSLRFAHEKQVTLIGCLYSPKTREGEEYIAPLDRIFGSGAWGAIPDTKIMIEFLNPKDVHDQYRKIVIMQHNASPQRLYMKVAAEDGSMTMCGEYMPQNELDLWLAKEAADSPGAVMSVTEMLSGADVAKVSRATLYRWIEEQVQLGALVRVGRGKYRIATYAPDVRAREWNEPLSDRHKKPSTDN